MLLGCSATRNKATRNKEHEKAVFNGNTVNDALAEHNGKCNCEIKWNEIQTIAVEPNWFRRKVRESLEIRCLKTGPKYAKGINRDYGDYVTTNSWDTMFDNINDLRKRQITNTPTSN